MTTYNAKMFESIKGALSKSNENKISERMKDFLRPQPGNTYVVRLLPNVKDPSKTFFHYYNFGWKSFSTGQNINVTSLQTWDQPDPIAEERYRAYNAGTEADKEKIKSIRRSENWLVNAYVISDSKDEVNNGTVKIIRFGKQLGKIIFDAIEGEGSDDYGPRVFDLGSDGCSLMIKVENQGEYPTYVSSKFKLPKAIDNLSEDKHAKIYGGVFNLSDYVISKSYDDLKKVLIEHYHCKPTEPTKQPGVGSGANPADSISTPSPAIQATTTASTVDDDTIESLLSDLE